MFEVRSYRVLALRALLARALNTDMITFVQGSSSAASGFISGDIACVYQSDRNLIQYGLVESFTYNSNPSYSVSIRVRYLPKLPRSGQRQEDVRNSRKGLIGYNTNTFTATNMVSTVFSAMGVTPLTTQSGSVVTFTDVNGVTTASTWATGTVVSALIPNLNSIVLGRIKRIGYTGTGTVASGAFRYFIESWNKAPSGPIMRTYACNEQYVFSSTTVISSIIDTGVVSILESKPSRYSIQVTPQSIESILSGSTLSARLSVIGGIEPYTWTATNITSAGISDPKTIILTPGINGTSTQLSSTPLTLVGGDSLAEFTISVSDSQGNQGSRFYSVFVIATPEDPGNFQGGE